MKAIYRGVACAELFNKKFEVPEHKTRTFEKTPEEIAKTNIEKLASRQRRDKIRGSGDNR